MAIAVAGKVEQYLGRAGDEQPGVEAVETEHLRTNRIVPVYPLTANITQSWLRRQMEQVVRFWAPRLTDPLPDSIRQSAQASATGEAIQQAHFPDLQEMLRAARERLAFDEIFYLQMGVLRQKQAYQSAVGRIFDVPEDWLNERIAALPFPHRRAEARPG